jgi:spermidine/putrescine transport system permease protein
LANKSLLTAFAISIYIFMYVPIFVLIIYSFDNSRLAVEWTGFTTQWYQTLFKDESIGTALKNSLLVATIAASTVMGTMAAVGLARARFAGKSLMSAMIILPIIVPEIAMAVSALILFISMGVSLGLASVIVAHIIFCLSYVALTVMARLEGMNEHLNEAALDLGASPWQAFYKVTLPLIAPGILSGALLAFVLSLDDFVITQFTAGVGATTLPLRIYSMVKFGVSPEINALSTLMLLVTICVTVTAEIIRQRSQAKAV